MRKVFFIVSLMAIGVVAVQYYLAAVGVFSHAEKEGFVYHGTSGRIVAPIVFLLLIATAALARAGRRTIWLTVLMLGLLIMQTLIFVITGLVFSVGPDTPTLPVAAILTVSLHAVNPLFIVWTGVVIALRARRLAFPGAAANGTDAVTEVTDALPAGRSTDPGAPE